MVRFIQSSGTSTSRRKSELEEGSQRLCPNLKCIKLQIRNVCRQNVDSSSHDPTLVMSLVLFWVRDSSHLTKSQHLTTSWRKVPHRLNSRLFCVIQGGAISILTACERPGDFAGVVLIAPMVQMNPDSATPFKVPHYVHSFSQLLLTFCSVLSFLIKSRYSVRYSLNPEVSRLTPLSPSAGNDCNTDTFYSVCVLRISVSTTWAAVAVSYWITDTSVSPFFFFFFFGTRRQRGWCQNLHYWSVLTS